MTQYTRGRRIEYIVKENFEEQGYTVLRSAGSHGPFDLVAVNKNEVVFIQVKYVQSGKEERESNFKKDIEQIKAVDVPKYARKLLVIYRKNQGITCMWPF